MGRGHWPRWPRRPRRLRCLRLRVRFLVRIRSLTFGSHFGFCSRPCFRWKRSFSLSGPHCSQRTGQSAYQHEPSNQVSTYVLPIKKKKNGRWETYNTTCRPKSLRLTPELIPIPLDIIHSVQNHKAVFAQHALCPGIRDPARLLLRARRIVHCPRVVDIIVRRDDVDLVFGLWGRVGGEELGLGFF